MKIALLSVTLLASISIHANEIYNCLDKEESLIREAIQDSHISREKILSDIEFAISERKGELSKKVVKKLQKSKYMLKCAGWRTRNLKFDCSEKEYVGYFMKVFPIFGNEVDVASYHMRNVDYDFLVGSIIHEATHKCGTNDADYFYQKNQVPHSKWYSEWQNIASTYDYWSIKGFCVPEIDC
ncbi:MAG: hypothetical protein CME66_06645 [Halobacteriovoraceae bacterium]|nr:hypothetical protein [Halobacteriovoraceae bacterium]|tara:strand:- start:217 stop:765 length:549 start_codon:yes stop_codon:yes gene_type:complete